MGGLSRPDRAATIAHVHDERPIAASPTLAERDEPARDDWLGPAIAILMVAAALRLYAISTNPPEFFEDELSGFVSAWSIVTTGHDVERTVLPFLTTRLELKQPLYFFTTVPFHAVLGDSILAARLPAVIFGVLTTGLIGWLAVRLSGRIGVGLAAMALFAVSPWAIHYARAGWEPAAVLPFTVGGLGLLWFGLTEHRPRWTLGAAIVLAIGAYAYHPALLTHVVLAGVVVLTRARTLGRADLKALAGGAALALFILIPYGLAATDPLFLARTKRISVFGDGFTLEALQLAWSNYWAQWDPGYLLGGRAPNPRINPGNLVLLTTVPLFIVGLDRVLHRRAPVDCFMLLWLILGPLPAALTDDATTPHAARGLFALPPLVIIAGIGTMRIVEWVGKRLGRVSRGTGERVAALGVAVVVLVELSIWINGYFGGAYVRRSANWWGYGTAAAFQLIKDDVPSGGTVCIATNDISGFTYPHQIAYYLPSTPDVVIESLDDERCSTSGTYILSRTDRELAKGTATVATVPDIRGEPFFVLSRVGP
jgi:4-amino-4-deoxy-L-arabinose transferase-like glycosyltransferase